MKKFRAEQAESSAKTRKPFKGITGEETGKSSRTPPWFVKTTPRREKSQTEESGRMQKEEGSEKTVVQGKIDVRLLANTSS